MSTELPITTATRLLRETFGLHDFRPGQSEAMQAILRGQDVMAVMPTGGGKSLCYQIPALAMRDVTLVISPLIALMRDQVDRLLQRGVAAVAIHSGMEQGAINDAMARVARGEVRLLYVAPERIESQTFRRLLRPIPLSMVAVDEAHCISEWGHDFRPAYRSIPLLFEDRPRVPVMAVTATATPDVRADISASLGLRTPVEIVRGFDRPNLTFRVERTPYKAEFITRLARSAPDDVMIVYCGSRRRVATMTESLQQRGVRAEGYHAGLADDVRSDVQTRFVQGRSTVLVATSAFGMGVDKANVRHVVHTDLTLTLEAYYQEAGRAGRDGHPATCTLLYEPQDRRLMDFFIEAAYPEAATIKAVHDHLYDRISCSIGQGAGRSLMADAASIGAALTMPMTTVNGALTLLERAGVCVRTSPNGQARIRLRTSAARLAEAATHARPERAVVLDTLIRRIGGRGPDDTVDIDVAEFLRRSGATIHEFGETMRALQHGRMIVYTPPAAGGSIAMLMDRSAAMPVDMEAVHRRRAHAQQKLDVVVRYAETTMCKRNFILQHFGDPEIDGTCGRCSSCTGETAARPLTDRQTDVVKELVRTAHQLGGRFGRQVVADVVMGTASKRVTEYALHRCTSFGVLHDRPRQEILEAIDAALAHRYLVQTSGMYPTLGASADGAKLVGRLPSPLTIAWQVRTADPKLVKALQVARDGWARGDAAMPSELATLADLERIARDHPASATELVPGRHGSMSFIERHGPDVIAVIRDHQADGVRAVPKIDVQPDVLRLVEAITPTSTLRDAAKAARVTPAAAAHHVQRALDVGLQVDRGALVPDDLYSDVLDYLRHHRRAGMRHVIEHLGGDVDLPVLRVAIAFARRDLFNAPSTEP